MLLGDSTRVFEKEGTSLQHSRTWSERLWKFVPTRQTQKSIYDFVAKKTAEKDKQSTNRGVT